MSWQAGDVAVGDSFYYGEGYELRIDKIENGRAEGVWLSYPTNKKGTTGGDRIETFRLTGWQLRKSTPVVETKQSFAGESRCYAAFGLDFKPGCPQPPAHQDNEHQTDLAKKEIRRWVACNYKDWPVCRHTQQPIPLEFWHHEIGSGWDGMVLKARFRCWECGNK